MFLERLQLSAQLVLIAAYLGALSVGEWLVHAAYRWFPLPSVLDAAWLASSALRALFAFRLEGDAVVGTQHEDVPHMIRAAGWGAETYTARTEDGWLLVLHRVLPAGEERRPPQAGAAVDAAQAAAMGLQPVESAWGGAAAEQHASVASFTRWSRGSSVASERRGSVGRGAAPGAGVGGGARAPRPPVLLLHGMMMSSDFWVTCDPTWAGVSVAALRGAGEEGGEAEWEPRPALAFVLARAGYDVWLGNVRGNRYSTRHEKLSADSDEYWDFALDEFSRFDLPTMLRFILARTGAPKVSVVGFSQGTAVTFSMLSAMPDLAERVACFAALSPAVSLRGLAHQSLQALMETGPYTLQLIFGRRALVPQAHAWRCIASPQLYRTLIDGALSFIFHWHTKQIAPEAKIALYQHLYAYGSVKSLLHFLHIMRQRRLTSFPSGVPGTLAPVYDVGTIGVPVALWIGDKDTILDVSETLRQLPKQALVSVIPDYEHLDTVWGHRAPEVIFPGVLRFLDFHNGMGAAAEAPVHAHAQAEAQAEAAARSGTSADLASGGSVRSARSVGDASSGAPAASSLATNSSSLPPAAAWAQTGGLAGTALRQALLFSTGGASFRGPASRGGTPRRAADERFRSAAESDPVEPATKVDDDDSGRGLRHFQDGLSIARP